MAQGKRHQAEYENYQGIDMQYTFFIFYAIGGCPILNPAETKMAKLQAIVW